MISPDRREKLLYGYSQIQPQIKFLAKKMLPGAVMLDVGCGEGVVAIETAKDLGVTEVILTDIESNLLVPLPPNTSFEIMDVCTPRFFRRFQNKVSVVTCLTSFHEFEDPDQAVLNLIGVLPEQGITLIMDYSEEGLAGQKTITDGEDSRSREHHQEDMRKTKRWGLDTNKGIRSFWESWFPRIPGQCFLFFQGDLYSVLYVAQQWGVIKHPPPGLLK